MDLALNNLQRLICHKTHQTNQIADIELLVLQNSAWSHLYIDIWALAHFEYYLLSILET